MRPIGLLLVPAILTDVVSLISISRFEIRVVVFLIVVCSDSEHGHGVYMTFVRSHVDDNGVSLDRRSPC